MSEEQEPVGVYQATFTAATQSGQSSSDAAVAVAEAYLDGKPRRRGKQKITMAERDAAFWSSEFLGSLPAEAWRREPLVLALARYMGQEPVSNVVLLEHVTAVAPDTVRRAVRYSGLVLRQQSPRCVEVEYLAVMAPAEFGEFVSILDTFDTAYRERITAVDRSKRPLAGLSPLELLVYASLYAFERLVPRDHLSSGPPEDPDSETQVVWDAINDLLIWKLGTSSHGAFRLTERKIGKSLAAHLSPFLFPSRSGRRPREDLYEAFVQLLMEQVELNSFITRSADAFSYNDSIAYELRDGRLEIAELDPNARAAWLRIGEKMARLHQYWFYRAVDSFAASELATVVIGKPENHEANRFAYIKAIRTQLQLSEVYGLEESVTAESGARVELFQALLSLELMTAFFKSDFMMPYMQYLGDVGNPRMALGLLASAGLAQPGFHNRFPITWSDRASKVVNITGWTVSKEFPGGNPKAADAILDFWTSNWALLAARLRKGEAGLHPDLFERPVLKMGRYLFQLPWVVAMQNNASAAINNLRRLGSRRREARAETRRIEERLACRFEERSFGVQLNYHPERGAGEDPGEVDLICARDGQVLVLEVKSTFLRRSPRDAWLHGATTLRKAGLQLRRKVQAVQHALSVDAELVSTLGLEPEGDPPTLRGWIVDTSLEHDHARFSGFLKVSLEEVLIALRDDRHLLRDPEGWFSATWEEAAAGSLARRDALPSLYPDGFSGARFVEVIESEAVWEGLGHGPPS